MVQTRTLFHLQPVVWLRIPPGLQPTIAVNCPLWPTTGRQATLRQPVRSTWS